MNIGENIKRIREEYQLTQTELGKIAGVSDKAVSTWENGYAEPRMGAIQRISDYFKIDKTEIMGWQPSADSFAMKLKMLRIEKGYSRKDLANILGIAETLIIEYESGDSIPSNAGISDIAFALNVPVSSLSNGKTDSYIIRRALAILESLNEEGQNRVIQYAQDLTELDKYKRQV